MYISKDAQAVVYRKNGKELEFLLLKRFDKDKNENHYRLIKGGVEENESPEEASVREVKEEAGLTKLSIVEKINDYSYQAGDIQHDVDVFLLKNTEVEDVKISSENEGGFTIEEGEWLSQEDAISYLNFDQEKENVKKALNKIS